MWTSMNFLQEYLGISLYASLVLLSVQLNLQRSQHWWQSIFRLLWTGKHLERSSISIDAGVLCAQECWLKRSMLSQTWPLETPHAQTNQKPTKRLVTGALLMFGGRQRRFRFTGFTGLKTQAVTHWICPCVVDKGTCWSISLGNICSQNCTLLDAQSWTLRWMGIYAPLRACTSSCINSAVTNTYTTETNIQHKILPREW